MVFPSIRLYLDPHNWHQEPTNQHQLQVNGSSIDESAHQLLPPLPPQAQDSQVGSIRPVSMADRAQIAKIQPQPEATLKCPRCESTSTKFCYFNNYSLAQPRHFCKTCRRYWTRGGALRNVPVGGGCRRNKKTKKGSGSKSPALPSTEKHSPLLPNSASAVPVPSSATCQELIGRFSQPSSNRGFMESLQNISISRYGTVGNMGQNELMGFEIGGVEQWRLQQFPGFLSGFESANNNNNLAVSSSAGSYAFQGVEGVSSSGGLVGLGDMMEASSRVTHQMPPVKLEGNGGVNLIRPQVMSGSASENNQYYSWTDLSGLAASSNSAGHHF